MRKKKIYKVIKIYFKNKIHEIYSPLSAKSVSPGGAVFYGDYILDYSLEEKSVTLKPGWQINVTEEATFLKFENDIIVSISNTKIEKIENIEREIFIKDAFPSMKLEDKIKLWFKVLPEKNWLTDIFLENNLDENKIIAWHKAGKCVIKITKGDEETEINAEAYEILVFQNYADQIIRDLWENGLVPPGKEWMVFQIPVTALMVKEFY